LLEQGEPEQGEVAGQGGAIGRPATTTLDRAPEQGFTIGPTRDVEIGLREVAAAGQGGGVVGAEASPPGAGASPRTGGAPRPTGRRSDTPRRGCGECAECGGGRGRASPPGAGASPRTGGAPRPTGRR